MLEGPNPRVQNHDSEVPIEIGNPRRPWPTFAEEIVRTVVELKGSLVEYLGLVLSRRSLASSEDLFYDLAEIGQSSRPIADEC